jgi:flagellar biosynthesis chaperone FliJ
MTAQNNEIAEAIERLQAKRTHWVAELNSRIAGKNKSAMKASDIRFIDQQIAKLEELEAKVRKNLDQIAEAMEKHTAGW